MGLADGTAVSRIEAGTQGTTLEKLERAAAAMGITLTEIVRRAEGVSLAALLADQNVAMAQSQEEEALLRSFRFLPREAQQATLATVMSHAAAIASARHGADDDFDPSAPVQLDCFVPNSPQY